MNRPRYARLARCSLMALLVAVAACSPESDEPRKSAQRAESAAPMDPTRRVIRQGTLTGKVQSNGSYAWLGIPFAKPPVGERRWQPPQIPAAWDKPFKAIKNVEPCLQFASNLTEGIEDEDGDGLVGSEDCLYLSIYAPSEVDSDDSLPVMFWIYGGGNNSGYAGDYNGGTLAESENVIVVTVNYRLGPLGWFIHPAILSEDATGAAASGNWSTLDTIRGLEWVRDNIGSFGGDPDNVTIFGESAGGSNVMSLMISPMAEGLFHKAIVQSGGVDTTSVADGMNFRDERPAGHIHSSREMVNKILIGEGDAEDREEAKEMQQAMSDEDIRELLYEQDAAQFLKLYNPTGARNYPAPKKFTDRAVFVNTPPLEQLAAGDYNQVPIILGTNRDERRIYMYRDPEWLKVLREDPDEYIRVAKYPSDAWKLRGVDDLARAMQPVQDEGVYAFRFDWDEEPTEEPTYEGGDLAIAIGAGHSVEMAFVFGDWDVGFVPKEIMYDPQRLDARDALSDSMMSYWANFAYTGSPGQGRDGEQPEWQPWQNGDSKPKMLILDTEQDGGIRMSTEEVTAQSIKSEFLADDFTSEENRCDVYRSTFERMDEFDPEEYASLGCED